MEHDLAWPAVAALAAIGGGLIAFATFWLTWGGKIGTAEAKAAAAEKKAEEADNKVTLLSAAFGMYRETVAKEYASLNTITQVEGRLTQAIDRVGDRFDGFMKEFMKIAAAQANNSNKQS